MRYGRGQDEGPIHRPGFDNRRRAESACKYCGDMADTDDQEAFYRPLGRLMITCGNLERQAYELAVGLGLVAATKWAVRDAMKRARGRLVDDPPPWSNLTAAEFDSWAGRLYRVLDQRNKLVHATTSRRPEGPDWVPVRLLLRDGSVVAAAPDDVEELITRAQQVTADAPLRRVLPEIKPGVHYHLIRTTGYAADFTVYYESEAGWPDSSSDEEALQRWWSTVPIADRIEWAAWVQRLKAMPQT